MSYFTYLRESDDLVRNLNPETNLGANYSGTGVDFGLVNIQQSDISKPYISQSSPATAYDNIVSFDFGAATPWDEVVIINHNFDPSIVVTVKSGTTGAVLDHTDVMTYRAGDMYFRAATPRTDRYLTIEIADSILTIHSYSIGRVMIGLARSPDKDYNYGWRRRRVAVNRTKMSELGARSVTTLYKRFEFVLPFSQMSEAQVDEITTFTDSLDGDAVYFFLVPNTTKYDGYVLRMTSTTVEEINDFHWALSDLVFAEESRGTRIGA